MDYGSKGKKNVRKGYRIVFLLAFCISILAEALLFMHTQVREISLILKEDFKIMLILSKETKIDRIDIEERIKTLNGVEDVVFITKTQRLKRLNENAPELASSVLSVGSNPMPDTFEVRLNESVLGDLNSWMDSVSRIQGISEVKYKSLEAYAILHALFYGNFIFISLMLGLMAIVLLGVLTLIYRFNLFNLIENFKKDIAWFWTGIFGAFSAVILCYAILYPIKHLSPIWVWPGPGWHMMIILTGGISGWVISQWKSMHS